MRQLNGILIIDLNLDQVFMILKLTQVPQEVTEKLFFQVKKLLL